MVIKTGGKEMLNPVTAKNGTTEGFGKASIKTKKLVVLIPDNQGQVVWKNKTNNVTTGNGFIEAGNVNGWDKSAIFYGVPQNTDFILEFKLFATDSAYAMVGVNIFDESISYTDIDFAFYRANDNISIYEHANHREDFGNVDNHTVYQIRRNGDEIKYVIDKQIIRTVNNVRATPMSFDCSIYSNMKIHEIKLIY